MLTPVVPVIVVAEVELNSIEPPEFILTVVSETDSLVADAPSLKITEPLEPELEPPALSVTEPPLPEDDPAPAVSVVAPAAAALAEASGRIVADPPAAPTTGASSM
jgi:hypothetical protein